MLRSLLILLALSSATRGQEDASSDLKSVQQAKLDAAETKLAEKQEQTKQNPTTAAASSNPTTDHDSSTTAPLQGPIEPPSSDDIASFVHAKPWQPHALWNASGAPHGLTSWKYPVDYLVDPDPKIVDGDLVPVEKRTQSVPTAAGSPITADGNPGITVSVWNPGWPLSAQQLRMIGLAINQVGGDHPELPMDSGTRCFCRVVAPIPRCACQNGHAAPILPPSKAKQMSSMLRDIENEAVRAIVKETEQYKSLVYQRRPSVYTNRIQEHRQASKDLRAKRIAGEWSTTIQELAQEIAHPSIEDASNVLARVSIGDVACIDSHWCAEQKKENMWVAATKEQTNASTTKAGWCVGVGRVVSVTAQGTACVRYATVHDVYTGDMNDYHLPLRSGTGSGTGSGGGRMDGRSSPATTTTTTTSSTSRFTSPPSPTASSARNVEYECGIELRWMTTNCSDATNVRRYELQVEETKQKEHAVHRIQMQQAALLTQHEVERTTTVLKLLRDETLERAREYQHIQRQTKERNAVTLKRMKENKKRVENQMNQEIHNNETEGIRNITIAQKDGQTALEEHRAKITKIMAYQKNIADNRVYTWKNMVKELSQDVARENRVPMDEIEKRVHEIKER